MNLQRLKKLNEELNKVLTDNLTEGIRDLFKPNKNLVTMDYVGEQYIPNKESGEYLDAEPFYNYRVTYRGKSTIYHSVKKLADNDEYIIALESGLSDLGFDVFGKLTKLKVKNKSYITAEVPELN